jgi:methanogenic corrinoid protein MtbC1
VAGNMPRSLPSLDSALSIGALSRATGIPVETLRTWEHRYGFPVPQRKPSGHRVYAGTIVPRLRRVAEALARGHRAGDTVGASDDALAAMLDVTPAGGAADRDHRNRPGDEQGSLEAALDAVAAFDADRLTRLLLSDSARLGAIEFLTRRIAPLIHRVGEEWSRGTLEIRHEHFLSERVGDLLRSLRLPFEARATGPPVVLATLPGEAHGLGLQMAALVVSAAGCRVLHLGTQVPPDQIASLARDAGARAVALSMSIAARPAAARRQVRAVRDLLPTRVQVLVGGDGAPRTVRGVDVLPSLEDLYDWARLQHRS